ncbi:MAG: hypothetical protein OXK82_08060 [Deltaproteobacteria bacterium]|nr:hypothetical protein [Deltaproteobacteria bacterium]
MIDKTARERPVVRIKPNTYRPSKTELEEDVSIDATPKDVIRAAFRPATVVEDPDA